MSSGWPREFAIVDCETTGLDARRDALLEVALVVVRDEAVVHRWSTLVDPGRPVPQFVTQLTGITGDDVRGKPAPAQAARAARDELGHRVVFAWNAGFDEAFLNAALGGGDGPGFRLLDAIEVAQLLLPDFPEYGLEGVAGRLGVTPGGHRALSDCEATAAVLSAALRRARGRGLKSDLGDLERIYDGSDWPWLEWLTAHLDGPVDPPPPPPPPPPAHTGRTAPPDFVEAFFAPGGPLAEHLDAYEARTGQQEYAAEVAAALTDDHALMIEAPTGIGKGLGYLVPAAARALRTERPVLVSTHTLALQDQLAGHDLPLLAAASQRDLRWAVLKGRGNYLCPAALEAAIRELGSFADEEDRAALAYLQLHARHSTDGQTERISRGVFRRLRALRRWLSRCTAGEGPCRPGRCTHPGCWLTKSLKAAKRADIIISNHALTLSWPEHYPEWHAVIFDEAHTLEDAATSAFAREVSGWSVRDPFARAGLGKAAPLGARLKRIAEGGALPSRVTQSASDLGGALQDLDIAAGTFASGVRAFLDADRRGEVAVTEEVRESEVWQRCAARARPLRAALAQCAVMCDDLGAAADHLPVGPARTALVRDLGRVEQACTDAAAVLDEILDDPLADHCYVVGEGGGGRMEAIPVDVAPLIHARVLGRFTTVLTSATLSTPGDTEWIGRRVGYHLLEDAQRVPLVQVTSPFDAAEASRTFITSDAPDPIRDAAAFRDYTVRVTAAIARELGGRTLLLLAANNRITDVVSGLARELQPAGIRVLRQGAGSRARLADAMRADDGTVLVGSRSFWEGVDIPGDALSAVIMEKIPFPGLGDPLTDARTQAVEAQGENGFFRYTLPRALLQMRQGAGRLLRRATDRGVVVLLDSRCLAKSYKRHVFAAFPARRGRAAPADEVVASACAFLREAGLSADAAAPPGA